VSVKEHEEVVADQKAEETDTAAVASEVAMQAPLALLGALLTSSGGPSSALSIVKLLARNLPLVVLLGIVGVLLWPSDPSQSEGETDTEALDADLSHKPNGSHPPTPGAFRM
jgi:hypothetical protein